MSAGYAELHDATGEYTMRDRSAGTMGVERERGAGRAVEITDVQTAMVDGNFPWTLVRVYTDAGVVDTGVAYWGAGVPELVERMTPFLVGENPLDADRLYEHLVRKMSGEGRVEEVTVTAISAIEVALHDLAGKILDVPADHLLGGKYRDEVRVYCGCHTETEGDPAACADEAERVVEEPGYVALKFTSTSPRATRRTAPTSPSTATGRSPADRRSGSPTQSRATTSGGWRTPSRPRTWRSRRRSPNPPPRPSRSARTATG